MRLHQHGADTLAPHPAPVKARTSMRAERGRTTDERRELTAARMLVDIRPVP